MSDSTSATDQLLVGIELDTLCFCRFALHVTFASITFTADTVHGIDILSL
jgi:hypothetical protein